MIIFTAENTKTNVNMKAFRRLVAACSVALMVSSCSILQGVASSATSMGTNTGSAIAGLYQILKSTGTIDLSNLTNLINLGKILGGANALAGSTTSYANDFASGLIKGSSNLVNSSNIAKVLTGLETLSSLDTSALSSAASFAATGSDPQISNSSKGVADSMSAITKFLAGLE